MNNKKICLKESQREKERDINLFVEFFVQVEIVAPILLKVKFHRIYKTNQDLMSIKQDKKKQQQ
jgi:hypothetical protein